MGVSKDSISIGDIVIRNELAPGDLGTVIHLHGLLYAREYGYQTCFESYVALAVHELYQRFDPERDRVWLCEHDGKMVGSLFLMHREVGAAQLRFFLIRPEYRGIGLGKLLMERFMASLRELGYTSAFLWTERELSAAASLYTRHGFRLTEQKPSDIFGRPAFECRYDLAEVR